MLNKGGGGGVGGVGGVGVVGKGGGWGKSAIIGFFLSALIVTVVWAFLAILTTLGLTMILISGGTAVARLLGIGLYTEGLVVSSVTAGILVGMVIFITEVSRGFRFLAELVAAEIVKMRKSEDNL